MKKLALLFVVFTVSISVFAQKRKSASYVKPVDVKPIMELDFKTRNAGVTLTGPVNTDQSKEKVAAEIQKTCLTFRTENPSISAELITSEITPRYDANGKFLIHGKLFLMVNYEAELIIKNAANEILATKKLYVKGDDAMGLPLWPTDLLGLSDSGMAYFKTIADESTSALNARTIEKAAAALRRHFCGYYKIDTLNVYSGKGKLFDYTELDAALELMKLTTKDIGMKKEDTVSTKKNLLSLIEIWNKEIATADLTDPEARISLDVYRGLQYNLATAYYFLKDYHEASIHASIARFDPTEEKQKMKVTNNFEHNVEDLQFIIDLNLYF